MQILTKPIQDIKPNGYNPNRIEPDKFKSLVENIKRFGYIQPILIDSNNIIIDGEHRWKACKEAGLNDVQCVVWESDKSVEEYKKLLTLSMNNLRGTNIEEAFENVLNDVCDKLPMEDVSLLTGFDEDTIESVLKTGKYADKEETEDEVPELPECLAIKEGDIILLGKHRIMCGDSTREEDVNKLMDGNRANISFTSPPYNVGHNLGYDNKSKYKNNDDNKKDYIEFLKKYTDNTLINTEYSFNNIQMNANNKRDFINYLSHYNNKISDILIWHKKTSLPAQARNVVNSDHEYIVVLTNKKMQIGLLQLVILEALFQVYIMVKDNIIMNLVVYIMRLSQYHLYKNILKIIHNQI
jgi:hypothetical protein